MLEMSWITAILQLYSQVADLSGNVIVKRINKRLFDLLARSHYILNLPRTSSAKCIHSQNISADLKVPKVLKCYLQYNLKSKR